MQTKTFTRKEFYELLWQNPNSLLIQQYETTFTELKDICTMHNIPAPGSGYWSKLRSGLTVLQTPLPELDEGE